MKKKKSILESNVLYTLIAIVIGLCVRANRNLKKENGSRKAITK